jgi:alpha-beta hydrolase superfamily lysophospholipase
VTAPASLDTISAADGTPLGLHSWEAPDPRAAVLILHGLGEHSGRYAELARHLQEQKISVFALDLRGHGASGGARGHVRRFHHLIDDVERALGEVARRAPALPLVLFGHSLGGLIALRFVQVRPEAPLLGLILSAPLLRFGSPLPGLLHRLALLLSRILPAVPLWNRIESRELSHDRREVEVYEADPLVHDRITPRAYREIHVAMTAAVAEIGSVRVPHVLIFVPGADPIVDPEATLEVAARLGRITEVDVRGYSGFYHEPLHETERGRPTADLTRWLARRTG